MLLIPFDRKIDWSRPPLVTLALVLINVLAFFTWQSGENRVLDEALSYYQESGLMQIEHRYYQWYLAELDTQTERATLRADEEPEPAYVYFTLLADSKFINALREERIVVPGDINHQQWKTQRIRFQSLMDQVVFVRYGLRTALPSGESLIAHMFLHADIVHLFGNMIFLLAVGFLVEATLGRTVFLTCYLLVGLGAAGFDFALRPDSYLPGIGASGAIAGLMGMYAVLYWTRRIRFFYFLFVYFDYISLPAITLLPLWIGNEFFQLLAYPESNVNFVAHLGGLCTGALVGLIVRLYLPSFSTEFLEREQKQAVFEQRLELAMEHCRALEFKQALPVLRGLYREQPKHRGVLAHLHQATRVDPKSEEYHRMSKEILALPGTDPATQLLRCEVFHDYMRTARPGPRLGFRLSCDLIERFLCSRHLQEAEKLFFSMKKNKGRWCDQQTILHRLADLAAETHQPKKAKFFRSLANQPAPAGTVRDGHGQRARGTIGCVSAVKTRRSETKPC